jgi:hypothetical protein
MGGIDVGMTQPETDHIDVVSGPQQVDGGGVPPMPSSA